MSFKEQLWVIIQKENPREQLMSFQNMKAEFDDVCSTFAETLTEQQRKYFEDIVLGIVNKISKHSVELAYETTFTIMNQMWGELVFGEKIPYLTFEEGISNA